MSSKPCPYYAKVKRFFQKEKQSEISGSKSIEVKILDERIKTWGLPKYQSDGAAGIDLFACVDEEIIIKPNEKPNLIKTGLSVFMKTPDIAALVLPRSGMGHKGLVLGNLVGLIDSDYTGEIFISAWNRNQYGVDPNKFGDAEIIIKPGDRIAQMIFVPIIRPEFEVVENFSSQTLRGEKGYGSTGQ